jgi:hypothetical protein
MRELLVMIHAGAGIAGLVLGLGVFALPRPASERRLARVAYGAALAILVGSLVILVVTDWPDLETGARIAFTGLTALAGVMLYRYILANRVAESRDADWERRYVGHIYFTYISLWVGFAIVPALRSPSPALWIPVAVIGVLLTGSVLVHRYERRIGVRPAR